MDDVIELIVYDIEKLKGGNIPDACILTFYPFPKEMLNIMYRRYLPNEILPLDGGVMETVTKCELMKAFLCKHFPEVDIVLMPMELSKVVYKLGDFWIDKDISLFEARELHKNASLFADFLHQITQTDGDFIHEGRRNRNIIKIPVYSN